MSELEGAPKHNYDLKVNDQDGNGNTIAHIYACVKGQYCIYLYGESQLGVIAEDESLISKDGEIHKLFYQIIDYTSFNTKIQKKYLRNIAYAIKALYDGSPESAAAGLRKTYIDVTQNLQRQAVIAYLTGVITASISLPLIIYLIVNYLKNLGGLESMIINAAIFSALGGFLSTIIGVKDIKVDLNNKFLAKAFFGALRIAIAITSGIVIYFLIQSNVLLGFIKDAANVNLLYIAFFLSGFSEKLVFNLMIELEGRIKLKKAMAQDVVE